MGPLPEQATVTLNVTLVPGLIVTLDAHAALSQVPNFPRANPTRAGYQGNEVEEMEDTSFTQSGLQERATQRSDADAQRRRSSAQSWRRPADDRQRRVDRRHGIHYHDGSPPAPFSLRSCGLCACSRVLPMNSPAFSAEKKEFTMIRIAKTLAAAGAVAGLAAPAFAQYYAALSAAISARLSAPILSADLPAVRLSGSGLRPTRLWHHQPDPGRDRSAARQPLQRQRSNRGPANAPRLRSPTPRPATAPTTGKATASTTSPMAANMPSPTAANIHSPTDSNMASSSARATTTARA